MTSSENDISIGYHAHLTLKRDSEGTRDSLLYYFLKLKHLTPIGRAEIYYKSRVFL